MIGATPRAASTDPKSSDSPLIAGRVRRRLMMRVVLLLFALYALFSLDRGNVGLAALRMNADLGLSAQTYGLGASLFTLAYLLFQVPATTTMRRLGASRGLAIVACAWGAASMANAFVWNANSFLVVRTLLGIGEAGFSAFVVYYIGQTFPRSMRGFALSATLVAVPITLMIASPLSVLLLEWNHSGLRGWQWLFVIEGAPTIILGLLCLRFIPDDPERMRFLSKEERRWLTDDLAAHAAAAPTTQLGSSVDALRNGTVWMLGLTLFAIVLGTNTLLFWMPQMIAQVSKAGVVQVGWLNAVPWFAFALGMLVMGRLSDRIVNRITVLSVSMLIAAAGFVVGAISAQPVSSFAGLLIGAFGVGASMSLFWTVPMEMFGGAGMAGAIAVVNVIGNSSGVVAHGLIGWMRDHTGGFGTTLLSLAGVLVAAVILVNTLQGVRGDKITVR